jgi:hypothetical protein
MNRSRFAIGAALIAFATLGAASPAVAASSSDTFSAQLVGVVRQLSPTTAEVQARYTCTGAPHLWVSVKQTADRTADPILAQEGSTAYATGGWSQSHDTSALICDGKNHVTEFLVDHAEAGFGTLAKGDAWVQFCLTIPDTFTILAIDQEFVHVR